MTTTQKTETVDKKASEYLALLQEANAIVSELAAEKDKIQAKLAAYEADDKAASTAIVELVDKLASTRLNGETLIPVEYKQRFIVGFGKKAAVVSTAKQLVDRLEKLASTVEVSGNDLGGPASDKTASQFSSIEERLAVTSGRRYL